MATATYEDALRVAQQLTPEEQDQLIQELQEVRHAADDTRWEAAFARSHDKLEVAAARVRTNRAAGRHIPLDAERA